MAAIINQFKNFFSIIFPIWILLAVTGYIDKTPGRIYALIVTIIFIALGIMLLQHVIMERSLLDEYEDRRNKGND